MAVADTVAFANNLWETPPTDAIRKEHSTVSQMTIWSGVDSYLAADRISTIQNIKFKKCQKYIKATRAYVNFFQNIACFWAIGEKSKVKVCVA